MKTHTKHGLDRKFKPWRKGKSAHSNKRSSLKQQLRGMQRLLEKLSSSDTNTNDVEKRRTELKSKIEALEAEIGEKQNSIQEKKLAREAHGRKFLERQKLTRLEKKLRKESNNKDALFKVALDQLYVAHHPNDIKYMPLYVRGERVVDKSRQLYRRAITRKRILKGLHDGSIQRSQWVSAEFYDSLPKDWSIQMEEATFGGSISRQDKKGSQPQQLPDDSRFQAPSSHEALLKAAAEAEAEVESSSSHSDDSDSDMSDHGPQKHGGLLEIAERKSVEDKHSSSDDSSSSSDDESISDGSRAAKDKQELAHESDSSSSSESISESEEETDKPQPTAVKDQADGGDDDDDFLVDSDAGNAFGVQSENLSAFNPHSGDKSQGWKTQNQRPGKFKKKRVRT